MRCLLAVASCVEVRSVHKSRAEPGATPPRDQRLNRMFAISYAPRGDHRASSRIGLFVTTVRNGLHGRWRLLEATTQPYD